MRKSLSVRFAIFIFIIFIVSRRKNCLESSFNQNFIITTTICFIIHALTCTSKMEFEVLQLVRYSLILIRVCMCWILNGKFERHFWLNNKAWNRSECVLKMLARCRLNQSPTKRFFVCVYRLRNYARLWRGQE